MATRPMSMEKTTFTPDKYYIEFKSLMPYFLQLETCFNVLAGMNNEYKCHLHVGMGKWISVGLYRRKWFRKEWRLDIALNYHYFDDNEAFFELAVHRYVEPPYFLHAFFKRGRGGMRKIKRYSIEEVQDAALLERDIRAVLDAELVTGKAWEF